MGDPPHRAAPPTGPRRLRRLPADTVTTRKRNTMSTWIVHKAHIDVLVNALHEYGVTTISSNELGSLLWQENHASVSWRSDAVAAPPYSADTTEAPIDPIVLAKAIDCYVYQSCEHPGWASSIAHRLVDALTEKVAERLGVSANGWKTLRAYSKAPWGITSLSRAHTVGVKQ